MNFFSGYNKADYQFVMNDFIIMPNMCNFGCDYCIFEEAPEQRKDEFYDDKQKIKTVYDKEGTNEVFFEKTELVLQRFNQAFRTPVLRICGGELFYIKDMISFIEKIHDNYETVQIISNGYFLNDDVLTRIQNMKNCILHISLDGHTQKLNSRRLKSKKQHEVLINNILNVIDKKIPLEIASCLTDINTGSFEEVIQFFSDKGGDVLLLPFPVRGEECKSYFPSEQAKEKFCNILNRYDNYKSVLPPKKYFESIAEFYQLGKRKQECHIPKTIVQTFHNGDICACCMDWSVKVGNITEKNTLEIWDAIKQNKMYNMYSMNPPRLKSCKTCFTVSDIINLYFNDSISREEIMGMKLFSGKETMKVMERIKEKNKIYAQKKSTNTI